MTPFEIGVVLHGARGVGVSDHPSVNAPIFPDTMRFLIGLGLFEIPKPGDEAVFTDKGRALVRMWCETPMPERAYIDPRNGKTLEERP